MGKTKDARLTVTEVPLTALTPYAGNPRKNSDAVGKVAESIKQFGFRCPIVADADGVILAGHTRYMAAKMLDLETVPVIYAADLDEAKARAFRLADNKVAEFSKWDTKLLDEELAALTGIEDIDLEGLGFDVPTLDDEGLTDEPSEEPETEAAPVSREGAVYLLGTHRLMCGDSGSADDVERLTEESGTNGVELLYTDPPYGVNMDKGFSGAGGFSGTGKPIPRRQYSDDWDGKTPEQGCFDILLDKAPLSVIWGGNYFTDKLPVGTFWLYWCKHQTMPTFGDGELAWTNLDRKSVKQFDVVYNGLIGKEAERWHPTQKPVQLALDVLSELFDDVHTVLDAFGGSGSTLIACEKLGKQCYMMEKSTHYCDVIRKRWAEYVHGKGCDWQSLTPEEDEQ